MPQDSAVSTTGADGYVARVWPQIIIRVISIVRLIILLSRVIIRVVIINKGILHVTSNQGLGFTSKACWPVPRKEGRIRG